MSRVVFYITGFGVFECKGSMLDLNPTDYLVQQIQNNLPAFDSIARNFVAVSSVSAINALQTLLDLQSSYNKNKKDGDISIFLHLGVSGSASQFTLEQVAYNRAKWNGPDTKNWIAGDSLVGFT